MRTRRDSGRNPHSVTSQSSALLDAGGDGHGIGDVHAMDAIGWASIDTGPGKDARATAVAAAPIQVDI